MVKARLLSVLGLPESEAATARMAREKGPGRSNRYQAVSIAYGGKCCAAVRLLAARRLLAGSAPSLPLPACTLPGQCKCSFRKYDDRRDDNRRLPGDMTRWYGGAEKRRSRGRRQVD
jgi:hypothetical protein